MPLIISFSIGNNDKDLINVVDDLAKQFDCSRSVIIKRALKMLCKESTLDPVALKIACKQNLNILNQVKRIVSEVENG